MKAKPLARNLKCTVYVGCLLLFCPTEARAGTFTVTTTSDGGAGSLRQAILDANANPGRDAIGFNIPGAGVQSIQVGSTGLGGLPGIIDMVDIDGYTQPGSSVNTATDGSTNAVLLIELNGGQSPTANNSIVFSSGSEGSSLRGLVINRFSGSFGGLFVGANDIFVGGCFIGTNPQGTAALPNGQGIVFGSAEGVRIGSAAPADRNLISGNSSDGVHIRRVTITDLEISGNLIGTNASGTGPVPNRWGIGFGDGNVLTDIRIGVPGNLAGNIISGNRDAAIFTAQPSSYSNARIRNNRIGTDITGNAAIPNSFEDTDAGAIFFSFGVLTVGGSAPGEGNVISGNAANGIYAFQPVTVAGNFIGTNATGTAALPNALSGIRIRGTASTIGGLSPGSRNVISGNALCGISVFNGSGMLIQGNFIGTNAAGTAAIGNFDGVCLDNTASNTIGGSSSAARNVISGNQDDGISITGSSATGNIVQGNFIGTDINGTADLGNDELGVAMGLGTLNNTIGGTASGAGNLIAFNGEGGVFVAGDSKGNSVLSNSIFSNTGLGIALFPHGVTPNDNGDGDTGANNLQNYPVLIGAISDGSNLTVQGSLNSTPNTAFRVEFFANATCDASGFGEGHRFLGATSVTTDASGNATIDTTVPAQAAVGEVITATGTNPGADTSEFSQCVQVTPAPTPTPTPTPMPTPTPTPTPVASPTPASTASPTPSPTMSPTPSVSPSPTPSATPTPTPVPRAGQLFNIATRVRVQTGENVLIGGFIITGNDPKKVMIRGIGPSLAQFFNGTLADPALQLFEENTLLASNNDWKESEAEIAATGIPPTHDKESAIVYTLAPGSYTAVLQGYAGFTGIGVVEVYDLDLDSDSKLANIASRGFVETGDNVMIGGVIVGPADGTTAKVVVRAIGPSLGNLGIAGALQDPALELVDANGVVLRANNDWKDSQQAEIEAIGLQPADTREAALIETLVPGNYTAIVRGAGHTTQGVALVEVYNVE